MSSTTPSTVSVRCISASNTCAVNIMECSWKSLNFRSRMRQGGWVLLRANPSRDSLRSKLVNSAIVTHEIWNNFEHSPPHKQHMQENHGWLTRPSSAYIFIELGAMNQKNGEKHYTSQIINKWLLRHKVVVLRLLLHEFSETKHVSESCCMKSASPNHYTAHSDHYCMLSQ